MYRFANERTKTRPTVRQNVNHYVFDGCWHLLRYCTEIFSMRHSVSAWILHKYINTLIGSLFLSLTPKSQTLVWDESIKPNHFDFHRCKQNEYAINDVVAFRLEFETLVSAKDKVTRWLVSWQWLHTLYTVNMCLSPCILQIPARVIAGNNKERHSSVVSKCHKEVVWSQQANESSSHHEQHQRHVCITITVSALPVLVGKMRVSCSDTSVVEEFLSRLH